MGTGTVETIATVASYEGLEFIDDGGYHADFVNQEIVWLPLEMARQCFDSVRLQNIVINDAVPLDALRVDIRSNGQLKPAILNVDKNGRIFASDGHHRFLCLDDLGRKKMSFKVYATDTNAKYGLRSQHLIMETLREMKF